MPNRTKIRRGERALGVQASAGVDPTTTVFVIEAFGRAGGKRVWERRIEATGTLTPVHDKHKLATPSPISIWTSTSATASFAVATSRIHFRIY